MTSAIASTPQEHGQAEDVFNVELLEKEKKTADLNPVTDDGVNQPIGGTGQSHYGNYGSIPNQAGGVVRQEG